MKGGKYVAVVIITVIMLCLFIFLINEIFPEAEGNSTDGRIIIITVIALVGLAGGLIAVAIERIREIKKEDKDDLSQY